MITKPLQSMIWGSAFTLAAFAILLCATGYTVIGLIAWGVGLGMGLTVTLAAGWSP